MSKPLRIKAGGFAAKQSLEIEDFEVTFCETAAFGGKRRFYFHQIECVLLSPTHLLSFQVRNEVFSVQTDPNDDQHRLAIEAFVNRVATTAPQESVIGQLPSRPTLPNAPSKEELNLEDRY